MKAPEAALHQYVPQPPEGLEATTDEILQVIWPLLRREGTSYSATEAALRRACGEVRALREVAMRAGLLLDELASLHNGGCIALPDELVDQLTGFAAALRSAVVEPR